MPAKSYKISVTCKRKSFRRAGRVWTDKTEEVEVNATMLKALKDEPQLIVFDSWLSEQQSPQESE
jgi:hypothetical protein